ncbi:MAG: hypothetical protein ABIW80_13715 [Lapillicoccus sp.]
MPPALAASLVAVMVAALLWRRRSGRREPGLSRGEVASGVLGTLGLVAHCIAMFFGEMFLSLLGGVPGVRGYADAVNGMGPASIAAYVLPAAFLLVAVRRRRVPTIAVLLALGFVGVTMYDGGPLWLHLTAISCLVVVLAGLVSPLQRTRRRSPPGTPTSLPGSPAG